MCRSIQNTNSQYSLLPGGNVTIHFNQLFVADAITIRTYGFLTLCEVDVLGTKVVLNPEGQFTGIFRYFNFCQDAICQLINCSIN